MSDRRVLGFAWLALAACLWFVLRDVTQWAFITFGVANPALGGSFSLASLVAVVVTVVVAVVLWKHKEVHAFCMETVQETRKVVWPTQKETRDHTFVVVVTSVAIALMLWGFDLVFKRFFGVILNLGA